MKFISIFGGCNRSVLSKVRIGIDFDNTLVCYDQVFSMESKKLGLMPVDWIGSKQELRDELQSRHNGERLWQTLQGRVYGPSMKHAVMYPGVAPFLMRSRQRGDELFIVSHKTEFGHFDSTRTPLRQVALAWMESSGFFEKSRFGLDKEKVFFSETRSEKVQQIAQLSLDVFIDDLEEVFTEDEFPPIDKVLFNAKAQVQCRYAHCKNWSEIEQLVLGPAQATDNKWLAQTFCTEQIDTVTRLRGRGNSRIYRVCTSSGNTYALKSYPDRLIDPRPRLRNETKACELLAHFQLTPKSIGYDEELNLALFEWIKGESPTKIETTHIDQALVFIDKLKQLPDSVYRDFPKASEACLTAMDLLSQVQERIKILESVDDLELQRFLETSINSLWNEIWDWFTSKWPSRSFEIELSSAKQILSPSDFGFHNSLQRSDGRLCFVDLEYFGRDDPVKLAADFVWHPAMNLKPAETKRWLEGMFEIFDQDLDLQQRFRAAWPMYGLRWVLILLNEFREDGWQKRVHANEELRQNRKEIQKLQIEKAADLCNRIRHEKMECPYV